MAATLVLPAAAAGLVQVQQQDGRLASRRAAPMVSMSSVLARGSVISSIRSIGSERRDRSSLCRIALPKLRFVL